MLAVYVGLVHSAHDMARCWLRWACGQGSHIHNTGGDVRKHSVIAGCGASQGGHANISHNPFLNCCTATPFAWQSTHEMREALQTTHSAITNAMPWGFGIACSLAELPVLVVHGWRTHRYAFLTSCSNAASDGGCFWHATHGKHTCGGWELVAAAVLWPAVGAGR
jgi:hypothetical protein